MIDINYKKRFLLVHLAPQREPLADVKTKLAESYALIQALQNVEVVDMIIQRDDRPHQVTYIGSGKAEQIAEMIGKERIDIIVINDMVKQRQLFALKKIFWKGNASIDVWDRIDLILQIFSFHAHTAEAKLQIRLAQMGHMGPRIYGMGNILSQQGGGIGTLGVGETNTELMKRHWRQEMKHVHEQLEKLASEKKNQLERRKRLGFPTVSLIGYTNAGKSTLFNMLTGKQTLVEDALFATLDSHVGKKYISGLQKTVVITDTIGFIQNLPAKLINAFHSTLLESLNANILLHVIDASDPDMYKKISVVREVLTELHIGKKEQIFIFNKIDKAISIDKVALQNRFASFHPLFISARDSACIPLIEQAIVQSLRKEGDYLAHTIIA